MSGAGTGREITPLLHRQILQVLFLVHTEFAAADSMGVVKLLLTINFQTAVYLPVVHTYSALMRQDTVSVSCGQ